MLDRSCFVPSSPMVDYPMSIPRILRCTTFVRPGSFRAHVDGASIVLRCSGTSDVASVMRCLGFGVRGAPAVVKNICAETWDVGKCAGRPLPGSFDRPSTQQSQERAKSARLHRAAPAGQGRYWVRWVNLLRSLINVDSNSPPVKEL